MPNKIAQFVKLICSIKLEKKLDEQYFNVFRGETKIGYSIKQIPLGVLPRIYRHAANLTKKYGERMFAADDAAKKFIKNVAYVGTIVTHYHHQQANFALPTAWKFPLTAGETTAVIDYNGDVRACELLDKFSTLRDFDYDFSALWGAESRRKELMVIDGGKPCWCTHVCFIHDSLRHSRKSVLTEVPKNYFTREKWV